MVPMVMVVQRMTAPIIKGPSRMAVEHVIGLHDNEKEEKGTDKCNDNEYDGDFDPIFERPSIPIFHTQQKGQQQKSSHISALERSRGSTYT